MFSILIWMPKYYSVIQEPSDIFASTCKVSRQRKVFGNIFIILIIKVRWESFSVLCSNLAGVITFKEWILRLATRMTEIFPAKHVFGNGLVVRRIYPVGIYLLKVNNRNTRTKCEIFSKLTIKTPKRHQWCRSGVFIVNFEHISHLFLVFLLLTLKMWLLAG